MKGRFGVIGLAGLGLLACDARQPSSTSAWTTSVVEHAGGGRPSVLQSVRAGLHEDYTRMVLDFGDDSLPGYHVSYIDRPVTQWASGATVDVTGPALLEVRLVAAQAHDSTGTHSVRPPDIGPDLRPIVSLTETCDFEGHVAFVAGLLSRNDFRVLELGHPSRLVIDIRGR